MPPKSSATGKRKNHEKSVAPDEKLSKVDISTSDPRTIVLMLDSPEVNVISKACEVLLKHVENSDQNILEIVELGGIPRMLKLISSPDKVTRCHAMLCLCAMAPCASVRRLLYKSDCIPALLKLLQPDEELFTQERTSFILTLLAAEYSFKVVLGEHNAHRPLLALTQSSDPDVQRNCVKVLCQLMENFQLRPAVLSDDGLPLLMKLLDSEYALIQELTLEILRFCVHHGPSRQVVANGEGLGKLVALLGDKDCADLHMLAVEVLGLCLADTNSMSVLQGSGCLHKLLSHISDSSNQQMKKHATNTLARAASDPLNRKILHENQVETTFIQLISKEDGVVVESACSLLGSMADLNTSRQLIGRDGGVAELVKHLVKGSNSVKAAAVHCFARLLQDSPSNCRLFAENGGLEALIPLFSDSQATCRQYAAECVVSLSCEDSMRQALISGGAVASMVGGLSFQDSAVQASTAQAIGMLACDNMARQQVCSSGGLEPLLQLLRSSNDEVLKNAIWMLMVCGQCPQIAEEACRLGAIELVGQVAAFGNYQCTTMAENALSILFGANLSAKYWVTGALDMTDSTVGTEFYDAGPGLSSHPFVPLSELLQQPLSKNQPIITANLLVKPSNIAPIPGVLATTTTTTANNDEGPLATVIDDGMSNTSISSGSRRGSRLHTSKSKRRAAERELESRVSQEEVLASEESKTKLPGLLEMDQALWDHIQHVITTIKLLPSTMQQLQELAKYVASHMGGQVERSGPLCFELPAGMKQLERESNLVPLGEFHQGSFQHRALLFKVLCDTLGVPCSLVRGEYSRHWNEVIVQDSSRTAQDSQKVYLVDLMFSPGTLLPANSPEAVQYQHII